MRENHYLNTHDFTRGIIIRKTRFKAETYEKLIRFVREEPALHDASLSDVSTPFENLCLVALKSPTSDHGIADSNPAGGENLPEPTCTNLLTSFCFLHV